MNTVERIGQDLWPRSRKQLVKRALQAKDGNTIRLSLGEAETLARQETEREIARRRHFLETLDASQQRPQKAPKSRTNRL